MKKILTATLLFISIFSFAGCSNQSQKQIIYTPSAPEPIGPYSQAVIANGMVYTSGQIGIDPKTNKLVEGGISAQTTQVFDNIKAVLKAANTTLDKVVKCNVYLANMTDFDAMNAVYNTYFTEGNYPARTACAARELPKNALVEIETIALL